MRVAVTQQGGLFGVDQTVEVVDGVARVLDAGKVTSEHTLDPQTTARLSKLAGQCASAIPNRESLRAAKGVSDAMTTTVAIDDGGASHELTVSSGDDVPDDLGRLIAEVMGAPYATDPTTHTRKAN